VIVAEDKRARKTYNLSSRTWFDRILKRTYKSFLDVVEMLKILVTGASGFVRKPLVERLIDYGHRVAAFDKRRSNLGMEFIQGDLRFFDFDDILGDVDIVFHDQNLFRD